MLIDDEGADDGIGLANRPRLRKKHYRSVRIQCDLDVSDDSDDSDHEGKSYRKKKEAEDEEARDTKSFIGGSSTAEYRAKLAKETNAESDEEQAQLENIKSVDTGAPGVPPKDRPEVISLYSVKPKQQREKTFAYDRGCSNLLGIGFDSLKKPKLQRMEEAARAMVLAGGGLSAEDALPMFSAQRIAELDRIFEEVVMKKIVAQTSSCSSQQVAFVGGVQGGGLGRGVPFDTASNSSSGLLGDANRTTPAAFSGGPAAGAMKPAQSINMVSKPLSSLRGLESGGGLDRGWLLFFNAYGGKYNCLHRFLNESKSFAPGGRSGRWDPEVEDGDPQQQAQQFRVSGAHLFQRLLSAKLFREQKHICTAIQLGEDYFSPQSELFLDQEDPIGIVSKQVWKECCASGSSGSSSTTASASAGGDGTSSSACSSDGSPAIVAPLPPMAIFRRRENPQLRPHFFGAADRNSALALNANNLHLLQEQSEGGSGRGGASSAKSGGNGATPKPQLKNTSRRVLYDANGREKAESVEVIAQSRKSVDLCEEYFPQAPLGGATGTVGAFGSGSPSTSPAGAADAKPRDQKKALKSQGTIMEADRLTRQPSTWLSSVPSGAPSSRGGMCPSRRAQDRAYPLPAAFDRTAATLLTLREQVELFDIGSEEQDEQDFFQGADGGRGETAGGREYCKDSAGAGPGPSRSGAHLQLLKNVHHGGTRSMGTDTVQDYLEETDPFWRRHIQKRDKLQVDSKNFMKWMRASGARGPSTSSSAGAGEQVDDFMAIMEDPNLHSAFAPRQQSRSSGRGFVSTRTTAAGTSVLMDLTAAGNRNEQEETSGESSLAVPSAEQVLQTILSEKNPDPWRVGCAVRFSPAMLRRLLVLRERWPGALVGYVQSPRNCSLLRYYKLLDIFGVGGGSNIKNVRFLWLWWMETALDLQRQKLSKAIVRNRARIRRQREEERRMRAQEQGEDNEGVEVPLGATAGSVVGKAGTRGAARDTSTKSIKKAHQPGAAMDTALPSMDLVVDEPDVEHEMALEALLVSLHLEAGMHYPDQLEAALLLADRSSGAAGEGSPATEAALKAVQALPASAREKYLLVGSSDVEKRHLQELGVNLAEILNKYKSFQSGAEERRSLLENLTRSRGDSNRLQGRPTERRRHGLLGPEKR
eukprot:g850.t1